mmetsp:Transcript_25688/g.47437  ORF Transcript_25688/g.47437 Transcript_25688/m.47437 type:complete len:533 (+) Transcript_25688:74-1672(+)
MSGVSAEAAPPAEGEPAAPSGPLEKVKLAVSTAFGKVKDYLNGLPWFVKVMEYLNIAWDFLRDYVKGMWDVFNALQKELLGFKIQDLPMNKYKQLKASFTLKPPDKDKCASCGKAVAEVFCVDCKNPGVAYCRFCACLLHHPSMKTEQHSIEEILDPEKITGVKMISPILPDLLFLTVVIFTIAVTGSLTEEHILGASYCPTTNRIRKWLVYFDPNIFYYYKAPFAENCNIEDSFWRTIVIDLWVRAIATGTDSMLLLLQSSFIGTFFAVFVNFFFSRIVGFLYGVFAQLVHWMESTLPREDHEGNPSIFVKLAEVSKRISFSKFVKAPPLTEWRRRPMEDYMENWRYFKKRQLRVFKAYEAHAQGMMSALIWRTWQACVGIRFLCIVIDFDIFIRALLNLLGFGSWVEHCRKRYMRMTGVRAFEDNLAYWSDWIGLSFAKYGFTFLSGEVKAAELSTGLAYGVRSTMWPLLRRVMIPALLIILGYISWKRLLMTQKEQYTKGWPAVRMAIYGTSGRDKLVDWKSVVFRRQS